MNECLYYENEKSYITYNIQHKWVQFRYKLDNVVGIKLNRNIETYNLSLPHTLSHTHPSHTNYITPPHTHTHACTPHPHTCIPFLKNVWRTSQPEIMLANAKVQLGKVETLHLAIWENVSSPEEDDLFKLFHFFKSCILYCPTGKFPMRNSGHHPDLEESKLWQSRYPAIHTSKHWRNWKCYIILPGHHFSIAVGSFTCT